MTEKALTGDYLFTQAVLECDLGDELDEYFDGWGMDDEVAIYRLSDGMYTNSYYQYTLVEILGMKDSWYLTFLYGSDSVRSAIYNTVMYLTQVQLVSGFCGMLVREMLFDDDDWELLRLRLSQDRREQTDHAISISVSSIDQVVSSGIDILQDTASYQVEPVPPDVLTDVDPDVTVTPLPVVPWSSVSFEDETVVASYMDNEYANHVKEAMCIMMRYPRIREWVAPGDGAGVCNRAASELGRTCFSGDISDTMIAASSLKGNDVSKMDAFEMIDNSEGPIMILYNTLSIEGLLKYIAEKHPRRSVIVLSMVDAFIGRSYYHRYAGTSRLYSRNIDVPPGIRLKPSRMRSCSYLDFWVRDKVYCVDNDMAYTMMSAIRRMAIPIKLSAYQQKYKDSLAGVRVPRHTDIYVFSNLIRYSHATYLSMYTGKEVLPVTELDTGVHFFSLVRTIHTVVGGSFLGQVGKFRYYTVEPGAAAILDDDLLLPLRSKRRKRKRKRKKKPRKG